MKTDKPLLLRSNLAVQDNSVLSRLEKSFEVFELTPESRSNHALLSRVDYLWIHFDFYFDNHFLKKIPNCKLVLTTTTGLTHFSEGAIRCLGPKLVSLNNFRNELERVTSTAELALNFIFHSQLNLEHIFSEVRGGAWSREAHLREKQISNLKIGIVGLGRLGNLVAKTISGLGSVIYFYEIDSEKVSQGISKGYNHVESLKDLCELSDIVSIHASVLNSRLPILTSEILLNVNTPFILINTSRSTIVDEEAVIDATRMGVISAYYTDVLGIEDEDQSLDKSIIWQESQTNSKINISPHVGGATLEAMNFCEGLLLNELFERLADK